MVIVHHSYNGNGQQSSFVQHINTSVLSFRTCLPSKLVNLMLSKGAWPLRDILARWYKVEHIASGCLPQDHALYNLLTIVPTNCAFWPTESRQCCQCSNVSCINEIPSVVQDVKVNTHGPDMLPSNNTRGLHVHSPALPEATVDDSAKLNCWFPWTPRLESRVGHGRELSEYGQRPLVRPVPVGLDQLCGQVAQHSCPCSVCSQINYIIEIENSFNQLA